MHCGTGHRARCGHHARRGHGVGRGRHHGASCGCGSHGWRRFQTREETIERLESYLQDLQKEAQAVEERIAALRAE